MYEKKAICENPQKKAQDIKHTERNIYIIQSVTTHLCNTRNNDEPIFWSRNTLFF